MGRLWNHREFRRLWAGETVEWVTDGISALGIPTIAIKLFSAGPLQMGILTALEYLGYPVLGLLAGVWVDRWRRKPVLIWTNIVQVIALASIPAAFLVGVLSFYQLFLVTLVMSVTVVFFNMAYTAYLPTLIDHSDLVEGNSKLETSSSLATVIGPSIAGALIKMVGAAQSIAADALGTLIAAIAILSIRKPEPQSLHKAERRFWHELREGITSVSDNPSLRIILATTIILNFGNYMYFAQFYLFIYNELKLSYQAAGIVVAMGAAGAVIGAISAPTLFKRLGVGPSLIFALLINGVGRLMIPTSTYGSTPIFFQLFWLFASIGIPIYNIDQVSFRQAIVSDEFQGRMNATMRTFGYGGLVLGALIGGVLGTTYGIIPTMTIGAIITLTPIPLFRLERIGRTHASERTLTG